MRAEEQSCPVFSRSYGFFAFMEAAGKQGLIQWSGGRRGLNRGEQRFKLHSDLLVMSFDLLY